MSGCDSCHNSSGHGVKGHYDLTIALAGNANVGKSAIFNSLTGLNQTIGNWPGKTVERAEGLHLHGGRKIRVVDLPGIYSLSTFSMEELVSRQFIECEKPDVIINVVDSANLERNLFFTLQLAELGVPMVVALNRSDTAARLGKIIDHKKLEGILGVPVVPTVAIKGAGLRELMERVLGETLKGEAKRPGRTKNGKAPSSKERYRLVEKIIEKVQRHEKREAGLAEFLDSLTTHPVFGYLIAVLVLAGLLLWTFGTGSYLSALLSNFLSGFESLNVKVSGSILEILWNGAFGGFVAGVTLVLPYVLPYYAITVFLEDSGYLPRLAFLLDGLMAKIGLHGKAVIPLILGYGCSVPACFTCRIMETPGQKLRSAFLVTLIPCTARTVVILGLVAAFVGLKWAAALYILDLMLVMVLGKLAYKALPGDSIGLIMEVPRYHFPSLRLVLTQTWARTKSLLYIVFPAYILGSAGLQLLYSLGVLEPVNKILGPITVGLLGLPAVTGVLLLFGIVRKELTILLLAAIFGTTNFALVMSPVQMIVLALVTMLYVPCLATILALAREFGWKKSIAISAVDVGVALLAGGVAFRVLPAFL